MVAAIAALGHDRRAVLARRVQWLCAAAACGRVGFAPADLAGDATSTAGDVTLTGDGALDAYAQAVLADGPIAYWRLADVDTLARDERGTYPGSYVGTCQHGAAGIVADNAATRFDEASCWIDVGDVLPLDSGPFSIELSLPSGARRPRSMDR